MNVFIMNLGINSSGNLQPVQVYTGTAAPPSTDDDRFMAAHEMSVNESGDNVEKCYDAYEDVKRTNFIVHLMDASQQEVLNPPVS